MFEILQQHNVRIHYNGSEVNVRKIGNFPDSVFLGPEGELYMSYWTTPKRRDERPQRRFRRYHDIYSLYRAIQLALEQAKRKKIPSLATLTEECRDTNSVVQQTRKTDQRQIDELKAELKRVLSQISGGRTVQTAEASEFITLALPFRDKSGKINTAVVGARLVGAQNRLIERMKNILSWLEFYGKWKEAIRTFVLFHQNFLPRLAARLQSIADSQIEKFISEGKPQVVSSKLTSIIAETLHLQQISGWMCWAKNLQLDLQQANAAIGCCDVAKAQECLRRAREAVRLKICQHDIHHLLLRLGLDAELSGLSPPVYVEAIERITEVVRKIRDSDWKTPVKRAILAKLGAAKRIIDRCAEKKVLAEVKVFLREAYRIAS